MIAEIRDVGPGGFGVASSPDGPVMIPRVLAGETVRFKVSGRRRGVSWGEAEKILSPSPHRVTPPCPFYTECGGCNLQHASIEHQLEIKSAILKRNLARISRIQSPPSVTLTASPPLHYRTRMILQIRNGRIGFFARNSHRLVTVSSCPLMPAVMQEQMLALREHPRIRAVAEGRLVLLSNGKQVSAAGMEGGEWFFPEGLQDITFSFPDGDFSVDPRNFVQANIFTMPAMQALARPQSATVQSGADLYAGAGFLTLSLARACPREVWAVESESQNLERLRRNLAVNGFTHVHVVESQIVKRHWPPVDFLVLDPPRKGVPPRVLHALAAIPPAEMVLFSCDSATFSRDLGRLVEAGFSISACTLIDNFPQTDHMEIAARLVAPA